MTSCQRRGTYDMYVVLHGLTGSLLRSLEQRTHIYVETTIGITGSYDLSTTVVTILTHLSDEDTRTTAFLLCELVGKLLGLLEVAIIL